jgi:glucokinase
MPRRRREASSRTTEASVLDASELVLGIDLGATKVVSGLVDPTGHVVRHSGRHLHENDGADGVIGSVAQCARGLLDELAAPPAAMGIGVAAQVDPETGRVIHAPNLRWRDVPLGARLAAQLGGALSVVNDARAATFAEWQYGAARGSSDVFCLIVGTGVGGSTVLGGRLIEGATHAAGEVGHLPIVSGGRRCHCPGSGCLEAYVGGWAVAERAEEAIRRSPSEGAAMRERAGPGARVTAETVFRCARAGDPLARRIVGETERFLGDGAVGIVNAFNPEVLVLAGGVFAGMPEFRDAVERAVRERCQPPAAGARVVLAGLGEDAALIGAAGIARQALRR